MAYYIPVIFYYKRPVNCRAMKIVLRLRVRRLGLPQADALGREVFAGFQGVFVLIA